MLDVEHTDNFIRKICNLIKIFPHLIRLQSHQVLDSDVVSLFRPTITNECSIGLPTTN